MGRRQASLYLKDQSALESLRLLYNPAQARLIPAHVTLLREDEVSDWDELSGRLKSLGPFAITLAFGAPVRDGDFVFLPITSGFDAFHSLRCELLMTEARKHLPHLTLIHPRNGICTDEIFSDVSRSIVPFEYTSREVTIIEQQDDGIWQVISRVGEGN